MWFLASAVLLVASLVVHADPQANNYLPPQNAPPVTCDDVTSTINTIQYQNQVIPTTLNQVNTKYSTTILYNQRVVPTTNFRTEIQTSVRIQTSFVQSETKVNSEQIITKTNRGRDVVETRYQTSTRVVPQVSYVTKQQVETEVVLIEVTNTQTETSFQDQVQYQTVPVQSTTIVRVPGMNVQSTIYNTQTQTSRIQNQQPAETRYRTTTLVKKQIQTQTIPSPPEIRTSVIQSQNVIPTTVNKTNFQNRFETSIRFVTRTQYETQTQTQTQAVRQEVVVTREVQREFVQTEYQTRVELMTQVQTRYETKYNTEDNVIKTQQAYTTSVVTQHGADRVVTKEVINNQQRQEVKYINSNFQSQITVTQTITASCKRGYNYPVPANPLRF